MLKIYDWENNILEYVDKRNNHFLLELRGNKNVIKGCSGTGKTFLCDSIRRLKMSYDSISNYDLSNIVIIDSENKGKTSLFSHKLILIDDADLVLDKGRVEKINKDNKNRYLFFCRIPIGLEVSPNHEADLITCEDGITRIKYRFSVKGWH